MTWDQWLAQWRDLGDRVRLDAHLEASDTFRRLGEIGYWERAAEEDGKAQATTDHNPLEDA